jgi:hypothetical protein
MFLLAHLLELFWLLHAVQMGWNARQIIGTKRALSTHKKAELCWVKNLSCPI